MRTIITIFFVLLAGTANAQSSYASITRREYKIPELCYAVVSADSVLQMRSIGVRKINTQLTATEYDRFRIGSNTKAITGYIPALLVKQGKISWDTKFFDLFPEMKAASRKEHLNLTLLNLLSFRAKLYSYTYTYPEPTKDQFTGNEEEQRYQFAQWFFKQDPVKKKDSVCFSNLDYIAAGLMLEKASGKSYKQLVGDLGSSLGINFGFGQPNFSDSLQTWGHDAALVPEAPADNYKLNWLLPAGNINVTLADYVKFIQLQLRGLQGRSPALTKSEFELLHFGLSRFAIGWFWDTDGSGQKFSYNVGNPGTFLTKVYVYPAINKAFILFANAQTDEVDKGLNDLFDELKKEYGVK